MMILIRKSFKKAKKFKNSVVTNCTMYKEYANVTKNGIKIKYKINVIVNKYYNVHSVSVTKI